MHSSAQEIEISTYFLFHRPIIIVQGKPYLKTLIKLIAQP